MVCGWFLGFYITFRNCWHCVIIQLEMRHVLDADVPPISKVTQVWISSPYTLTSLYRIVLSAFPLKNFHLDCWKHSQDLHLFLKDVFVCANLGTISKRQEFHCFLLFPCSPYGNSCRTWNLWDEMGPWLSHETGKHNG